MINHIDEKKWLRVPDLRESYGITKGATYRLLKSGRIKSASLKTDSANSRGVRLIDRASLESYLESIAKGGGE